MPLPDPSRTVRGGVSLDPEPVTGPGTEVLFPRLNGFQETIPISRLAQPALTARPETPVQEIKDRIGEDQPLEAVVVLSGERPVGLVMSLHMDRALSHRFGVSLYYERPVSRIMDTAPLVVEGETALEVVARAAMNRERARMYDDVIIVQNGRFQGTVSVRRILQTMADRDQQKTDELTRINQRLSTEMNGKVRVMEALEESRKMLQLVIDSMPIAVFWKDRRSVYMGCNRLFASHAGLNTPEEVVGRTDRDLGWRLQDVEAFLQSDQRVMQNDRPDYHIIETHRWANGKEVYVDKNKIPLHDHRGMVVGILGTYEDITEKLHDEKERVHLRQQLRRAEKMEAIGTVAGGVAHDLNNILSGIVSYPELLLLDLAEDSPLRRPIQTIKESGERAAAIVQDLLTLTRRGVTAREVLSVNDIVRKYTQSPEYLNLASHHPGVTIDVRTADDLLPVTASSVHLSKTLMNLVANAFEAMPDGGTVTLRTENRYLDRPVRGYDEIQEGDYVVISVTDTGVGIAEEDVSRIFEPFYTRKIMGRSGTGLGMAVVWGTVKDHNGYIDVESRIGAGTTFTLFFPAVRSGPPRSTGQDVANNFAGRGETVLVIDDVEAQRTIATLILRRLGYVAEAVPSGEEAVEYLKRQPVDLLVLDMIMTPGIDGLETYQRILEIRPGQKAIIASGFSENDRVRETLRLGAGAYVKKPYTIENLGLAVRRTIDGPVDPGRSDAPGADRPPVRSLVPQVECHSDEKPG